MDPVENKKALRKMIVFHAVAAVGILLFPLYVWLSKRVQLPFPDCVLHDWLLIYCPLCGGTRAIGALLRLDVLAALRYNAYAVFLAITVLIYDALAWIRLFRGEKKLLRISRRAWLIYVGLLLGYWILRNVLLIGFGVDPLGDLAWFWNRI